MATSIVAHGVQAAQALGYHIAFEDAPADPVYMPPPARRRLAPDVIALWPEDRPAVANIRRRGANPRGVIPLYQARNKRLRPGVFAMLWERCLSENRGIVVEVLGNDPEVPYMWFVRAISAPIVHADVGCRRVSDGVPVWKGRVEGHNLRRCQAPRT